MRLAAGSHVAAAGVCGPGSRLTASAEPTNATIPALSAGIFW